MTLYEIQSTAAQLLQAHAPLANATIVTDDGGYPNIPAREKALRESGLVLIVWPIESDGLTEMDPRLGFALHDVQQYIVVEENVSVNRGQNGTGIIAEKAVQHIFEALIGKPKETPFLPADPPFKNFGKIQGVNKWLAALRVRLGISPSPG